MGLNGNAEYKYSLKNKHCGDHIIIEFDPKNEKITNFRYEEETCIFVRPHPHYYQKN